MSKKLDCRVCGNKIPHDRHNAYCSKRCQATVEGWSNSYSYALGRRLNNSESFRPLPLDNVIKIITTDPICIFSDAHAPIHSALWAMHAIRCGHAKGAKTAIINGDFLDLNQISAHAGSYARRGASLESDFDAGEALLSIICDNFDRVVFLMGNHCMRLVKHFGGELSVQRVYKMLGSHKNLEITSRSFVDVNNKIRVVHPRQYSRIRGALSQKLCMRWKKSIITGHQHHSAMTLSPDGLYQACDVGTLADVELQDYVRNECTDHVEPVNGFAMIFGDYIQCFDSHTKWDVFGLPELSSTAAALKASK